MNLVIISTNKNKYSETFIHNHLKLLPANIYFLFDGYLPQKVSTDKGLTSQSILEAKTKQLFSFFSTKKKSQKEVLQIAIKKYLINNKIDAILCEYGPSGVEMMEIAEQLTIPLIVHFHGYDAYRNDILNSYGKQYIELFNIASSVIAVSKHMVKQLKTLGCPEKKLHHLCYGINTTIFSFHKNTNQHFTFVSCGRFVEKKAPQIIIKAFELVLLKFPKSKLMMIGDGELLDECKTLSNQLNIASAIQFTGVLNQYDILQKFKSATAFLQHSITTNQNDLEGTPLTIMEAMACGLPVIATKHGGIIDVIKDNETGFLVDEKNISAMAEKMIFVLENPLLAKNSGEAASHYIFNNHTLDVYTQKLFEIIKTSKK